MMELIRSAYDWWIAKLRAIRHSKPPEPPMRLRLHEAGYAVVGYRFGYTQQGIMLREDDTGETSQQYACISSSRCFVFSHVFFSGLGSCMHFPYFSGCAEVFLPNMRASLTRRSSTVSTRRWAPPTRSWTHCGSGRGSRQGTTSP